jgi:hypothetical protein
MRPIGRVGACGGQHQPHIRIIVLGPAKWIRCLFDIWIRNPGWIKNQDPDTGSGMKIPDQISESLDTIF